MAVDSSFRWLSVCVSVSLSLSHSLLSVCLSVFAGISRAAMCLLQWNVNASHPLIPLPLTQTRTNRRQLNALCRWLKVEKHALQTTNHMSCKSKTESSMLSFRVNKKCLLGCSEINSIIFSRMMLSINQNNSLIFISVILGYVTQVFLWWCIIPSVYD